MNASWLSAGLSVNAVLSAAFAAAAFIILLALLLFFISMRRRRSKKSVRRDNHRISVREVIKIDERRRLVLIRRDNIEHLLLTGGDSDLVVESFPDSISPAARKELKEPALFASHEGAAPLRSAAPVSQLEQMNNYTAKPQALPAANAESAELRRSPVPSYTPAARQAQQAASRAAAAQARLNAAAQTQLEKEAAVTAERGRAEAEKRMREGAVQMRRESQNEAEMRAPRERAEHDNDSGSSAARKIEQNERMARAAHGAETNGFQAEQALYKESEFAPSHRDGREAEADGSHEPRGAVPHNAYAPKQTRPRPQNSDAERGYSVSNAAENSAAPAKNNGEPQAKHISPDFKSEQEREIQPRSAPGVYAPYLGYMPGIAPRQAPPARPQSARVQNIGQAIAEPHAPAQTAARGQNTAADKAMPKNYGGNPRNEAAENMHNRPNNAAPMPAFDSFETAPRPAQPPQSPARQADAAIRRQWGESENGNARREETGEARPQSNLYGYGRERNLPKAETHSDTISERAPFNPFQEMQQDNKSANRGGLNAPDRGSYIPSAAAHNGNGFAHVTPADDNDFDKILQDELLRAPNTIRFPASQKK